MCSKPVRPAQRWSQRPAPPQRGRAPSPVRPPAPRQPTPHGFRISTSGEEVTAEQVIVAAGPWIGGFIPDLGRHLRVTRQAVGWFMPAKPEIVGYGEFPVFIVSGKRGLIYGFPDFEGRG